MRPWADGIAVARYRAYAPHPGPGRVADGESAWLESLGYHAAHWGASLLRPHLDDVPDRPLPDGIDVRAVEPDMLRTIWEAHHEAFRDDWSFHEPTEAEFVEFVDDPLRDETLWKVAWCGGEVVGQVKSYVNEQENLEHDRLRGYTEEISVHAAWRNRGIAGALLAMSLEELRDRGMTEAALGVDTDNPGGALHLYTSLGFELQSYGAVYEKPV
jgi:ribosomal protein S18 acetylase RimI-like enzyme